MVDWTAGAVFGVVVLIVCVPVTLIGMIWFWNRRNIQPIKARSPTLVIVTDTVLLLYVILLCVQRIAGNSYPCLLNVWSGYIGTVVLFNTYLWRCWTLYFTFHLTQQKLSQKPTGELPFFIRNRHYISGSFLFKLVGTITVILILPCGILTANYPILSEESGDVCSKKWGDALLAVYVGIYVALFLVFGFNLRQVADGFKIKLELKFTGCIGIIAVIPWFIFNQSAKTINRDVFPFSTLCLILAIMAAFGSSTLWPLYRSIFAAADPMLEVDVPEDLTSLHKIIETAPGLDCFTKFLTKEFSVENILFYQEIVEFRKNKKLWMGSQEGQLKLIGEARRVYAKYIISDAPFQVNLPDHIVKNLENTLKHEFANASKAVARMSIDLAGGRMGDDNKNPDDDNGKSLRINTGSTMSSSQFSSAKDKEKYDFLEHNECPTIFDAAQKNIYMLMETDSTPRFLRSELYKEFVTEMSKSKHRVDVLRQMDII